MHFTVDQKLCNVNNDLLYSEIHEMFVAIQLKFLKAQNYDGENIDEFPAICQYFPYQNFPFS